MIREKMDNRVNENLDTWPLSNSIDKTEPADMREAEIKIQDLRIEYNSQILKIVEALAALFNASLEMRRIGKKFIYFSRLFKINDQTVIPSILVGNLTLYQFAHLSLWKLEEHFPEIAKKVKYPSYTERFSTSTE